MNFLLNVHFLVNVKMRDKAIAHAERLFPDLPVRLLGNYEFDHSQWEFAIEKECDFTDEKTALWEVLTTFSGVGCQWRLTVCPNTKYGTVVAATAEDREGTGMTWCDFKLMRYESS